jgi:hypothetical protein
MHLRVLSFSRCPIPSRRADKEHIPRPPTDFERRIANLGARAELISVLIGFLREHVTHWLGFGEGEGVGAAEENRPPILSSSPSSVPFTFL